MSEVYALYADDQIDLCVKRLTELQANESTDVVLEATLFQSFLTFRKATVNQELVSGLDAPGPECSAFGAGTFPRYVIHARDALRYQLKGKPYISIYYINRFILELACRDIEDASMAAEWITALVNDLYSTIEILKDPCDPLRMSLANGLWRFGERFRLKTVYSSVGRIYHLLGSPSDSFLCFKESGFYEEGSNTKCYGDEMLLTASLSAARMADFNAMATSLSKIPRHTHEEPEVTLRAEERELLCLLNAICTVRTGDEILGRDQFLECLRHQQVLSGDYYRELLIMCRTTTTSSDDWHGFLEQCAQISPGVFGDLDKRHN